MMFLLIEDDRQQSEMLMQSLNEQGHEVDVAYNGLTGLEKAMSGDYSALIVDRMLPFLDGLSLVRRLRENGVDTPVLFLTTMSGLDDRVEGLEAGADDYLVKPFALTELMARVNAITRRVKAPNKEPTRFRVADLELDLLQRTVRRDGKEIDLQPQEFRLLAYMMRNAGQALTRSMLLENVWDITFDPRTNIVETHLSRLRGKVDRGFSKELIHTLRGHGYVLRAE